MRTLALIALLALPALADVSPKRPVGKGWIWIAEQGAGRIIALDRASKIVWSHEGLGGIRDFNFTPKGTLITGTLDGHVREISLQGKVLWEHKMDKGVYSVQVRGDGHVVIGTHDGIVEISRDGRVVWEYSAGTCPEETQLLPDDRLLVAWYGGQRVQIVDRDKKVVRELKGGSPMGANLLKDGQLLRCDVSAQRVQLIAPDDSVRWEYHADEPTPHATMTKSGDVLISHWKRIVRVDRSGRVTWSYDGLRQAIKVREW